MMGHVHLISLSHRLDHSQASSSLTVVFPSHFLSLHRCIIRCVFNPLRANHRAYFLTSIFHFFLHHKHFDIRVSFSIYKTTNQTTQIVLLQLDFIYTINKIKNLHRFLPSPPLFYLPNIMTFFCFSASPWYIFYIYYTTYSCVLYYVIIQISFWSFTLSAMVILKPFLKKLCNHLWNNRDLSLADGGKIKTDEKIFILICG